MTEARPVLVVTEHWGDLASEPVTITRLVAGALARQRRVEVIFLDRAAPKPVTERDSVFVLHRLPLSGAEPLRAALVRVALRGEGPARAVPATVEPLLERYAGRAADLAARVAAIDPEAIVLAGASPTVDLGALSRAARGARVLFIPILDGLERAQEALVARQVAAADRIATIHPGEHQALLERFPERRQEIVPLDVALTLNRSATEQLLFGVHWFGTYVLLIRAFPPASPRYERSITRELLSSVLGVSVAEVDGETFKISDRENTVELPVNPTRVNLWRLMRHAEMTVDVRPPGPFGQEAIESMLLGTPVVVPSDSAAHASALAAGGGLGYGELGELLDAARALLAPGASFRAGTAGRTWAEARHGDMAGFVERVAELALSEHLRRGEPAAR